MRDACIAGNILRGLYLGWLHVGVGYNSVSRLPLEGTMRRAPALKLRNDFFFPQSPTSDRRVRTERGSWPVYREGIDSDSVPCRWHSPCKWCRAVAGGELCYYCGALTEPATVTLSKATRPATILLRSHCPHKSCKPTNKQLSITHFFFLRTFLLAASHNVK